MATTTPAARRVTVAPTTPRGKNSAIIESLCGDAARDAALASGRSSRPIASDQRVLARVNPQLHPVVDPEVLEDGADMDLHGSFVDGERIGNLLVPQTAATMRTTSISRGVSVPRFHAAAACGCVVASQRHVAHTCLRQIEQDFARRGVVAGDVGGHRPDLLISRREQECRRATVARQSTGMNFALASATIAISAAGC